MLPPELKNAANTRQQPIILLGDDGELLRDEPLPETQAKQCTYCGWMNTVDTGRCAHCLLPLKDAIDTPPSSHERDGFLFRITLFLLWLGLSYVSPSTSGIGLVVSLIVIMSFAFFISQWSEHNNNKK
jgi:hypothetical protein